VRRLTADVLNYHGVSFAQAVAAVRQCLPRTATLVGQNVGQDIEWLQLKEGTDFKACAPPILLVVDSQMHSTSPCQQPHQGTAVLLAQGLIDLQGLWRVYNPKYKNYTGMSTSLYCVACSGHPFSHV